MGFISKVAEIAGRSYVRAARRSKSPAIRTSKSAPHPVRPGYDNAVCPITGASASRQSALETAEAKAAMDSDPDIVAEREANVGEERLESTDLVPVSDVKPRNFVRLNVSSGTHFATTMTRRLVQHIGGVHALQTFTDNFYEKSKVDAHIHKFIADPDEDHGVRFACWIAEKMGDGTPWTAHRRSRPVKTMRIGGDTVRVAFDRSSAHFAAWHSPKREAGKYGSHFKLDDARVWMRLHFWAAREVGMFRHPEFMDYYIRLIGHFVSVYSSKSPAFTRESARWSANPQNIQKYLNSGHRMVDVIAKPYEVAIKDVPEDERIYTGSRAGDVWPYEHPSWAAWLSCSQ